ncbi:MAG: Rieske 2Fe-2S domain-containing protein [Myxococcota bacterium]
MTIANADQQSPPPRFEEARNTRQKVRAAGLDPDYWYAVEHADRLEPGEVVETKFWGQSIAIFRTEEGELHAIANRCAHRQLKLTTGHVSGCNLVCPYHGWAYDGAGKVVDIPHSLFGRKMPKFKVPSYPLQVRYGLVWIFPGDPEMAEERKIPDIPELEGPDRWACVPVSMTIKGHHSMIIDNVSDFTHAYLHRKYRPFDDAELTRLETIGDDVHLEYDTLVGRGKISGLFVDRDAVNTNHMELCYEYPYQWSNTDGQIKHWLFVLPIDERTTKTFFLFYFKALKIPFLPVHIPRQVMTPVLKVANEVLIKPLLSQDVYAVEAEQEGWEAHWDKPLAELNPAVKAFQEVTIRKWEEYLERTGSGKDKRSGSGKAKRSGSKRRAGSAGRKGDSAKKKLEATA